MSWDTSNMQVKTGANAIDQCQGNFNVFTGVILPYGGVNAPSGTLLCDGASYLRSAYPNLFAVIGTAFGAADANHFNVPNVAGKFMRFVDGGAGVDPDTLTRTAMATGGNVGDAIGSIQADTFKSHTHIIDSRQGPTDGSDVVKTMSSTGNIIPISPASTGGNETRPVNFYCNAIIIT